MKTCQRCGRAFKSPRKYLCEACHSYLRYHSSETIRRKHLDACRKWQREHPEQFRKIVLKAVKKWQKNRKTQIKLTKTLFLLAKIIIFSSYWQIIWIWYNLNINNACRHMKSYFIKYSDTTARIWIFHKPTSTRGGFIIFYGKPPIRKRLH